ncbi:ABC transporter permease [Aquimarina sp. MMG015]|uniref:ABC transporter permease n=1 Tax=Aquimarina TaxID=290174 RepID=UPI000480EA8C|nr:MULTISPECIES: ABC transporter permease [Aquimarina]AXT56168.1 ABC transporter permease [Aquimarina sp. AD1]MBQ4803735.1 ABC transporter permease [Aquimarina sp. MMG015]RKN28739.1 ABC transporter permease [Aquimarina sp. AD1]
MSSNLQLIIKREFISRVRNRTFVVMTFLSPLIVVGMIALIAWLTTLNNDEVKKVAYVDETKSFAADLKDTDEVKYIDYSSFDLETAKDSVISQKLYGLLYIPNKSTNKELAESIQFYAEESPNFSILNKIERIIANKLTKQNYKAEGLNLEAIESSKARINIQIENFSGEKTSKMSNYVKMAFGGFAGYLLMMFIIIYGNMVMRSVIEEKTNRIIEIIISSVKPMQLMMGKILGTSFAGILQFFIWVILGGVLLLVATSVFGIDPQPVGVDPSIALQENNQQEIQLLVQDILKLPLLTLVSSFFVYFIGGYFLYSSIYAAIGAAVDSETDSQQFMLPIILPLMLGIYVGFFAVIENPHGTVSTVFSMIPLTSPIVMLMRIPFGVPWWEILISIALLIGSIIFMVWFAGKIYRIGILMYGKKPSYKELFKWLKY